MDENRVRKRALKIKTFWIDKKSKMQSELNQQAHNIINKGLSVMSDTDTDVARSPGPPLAQAEALPVLAVQLVFTLLLAIVIAVSLKIVGALLIVSMLIIPAATARPFTRSPEAMAVMAAAIGIVSVSGGLYASISWDTPSGPSIVVASSVLFLVSLVTRRSK